MRMSLGLNSTRTRIVMRGIMLNNNANDGRGTGVVRCDDINMILICGRNTTNKNQEMLQKSKRPN